MCGIVGIAGSSGRIRTFFDVQLAPEVSLRGIRVTKADRDIYVLLVSEESLPHPEVLEAQGVVSRGERGGSPLERFFREVGARTRGEPEPVPARWNLQRATVQCSPAAK